MHIFQVDQKCVILTALQTFLNYFSLTINTPVETFWKAVPFF